MTNRRWFLKQLIATAAFISVPATVIKAISPELGRQYATKKLHAAWMVYTKGNGGKGPCCFVVGQDLFTLYESELQSAFRFVEADLGHRIPNLKFKATIVIPIGKGYGISAFDYVPDYRYNPGN